MKKFSSFEKESRPDTEGKQNVDRNAYKLCVEQQKRTGSTNPWAICNAQFGIGKSEHPEVGQSFSKMKKKESNHVRTDRSSAKKITAAQKEHMKPTHPQTGKIAPKKIAVKQPVYKSELEPGQSFVQLQKMQAVQDLAKKPSK